MSRKTARPDVRPGLAARLRTRRREAVLDLFPSSTLFIAGILTMPALLFNPSIPLRIVQFAFFVVCAWAVGKRVSPLNLLIVSASIVAFNLLIPYGRVLATIGSFRITQGALWAGIEKAVTVEGLIMLSKATIRSDLRLPGSFGALIGESFRYLELIMEKKGGIERKDPIGGIDRLLIELSGPADRAGNGGASAPEAAAEPSAARTGDSASDGGAAGRTTAGRTAAGRIILIAAAALAWAPFILAFATRRAS